MEFDGGERLGKQSAAAAASAKEEQLITFNRFPLRKGGGEDKKEGVRADRRKTIESRRRRIHIFPRDRSVRGTCTDTLLCMRLMFVTRLSQLESQRADFLMPLPRFSLSLSSSGAHVAFEVSYDTRTKPTCSELTTAK